MSAPHSVLLRPRTRATLAHLAPLLVVSALLSSSAAAQTSTSQTPSTDQTGSGSTQGSGSSQGTSTQNTTGPTHTRVITDAQGTKLALAAPANYKNRFEVYGGVGVQNFQAGQNLPTRMNFATLGGEFTYWLRPRLGLTADYRFEGGTTPVFPNRYYNRPAVFQHNFFGGVTYRGPKNRYAAIDYHALVGGSYGIFNHTTNETPNTGYTATDIGLYSNRFAFMSALGGSVDFNYTRNIAFRLQPDLILEHYGTELREFGAVSGGILYRFGKR